MCFENESMFRLNEVGLYQKGSKGVTEYNKCQRATIF